MFTSGVASSSELYPRRPFVLWTVARFAGYVAVLAGALAAALRSEVGMFVSVAGLVAVVAVDVAIGVAAYRRAMRAPWPQVTPLDDDDWD